CIEAGGVPTGAESIDRLLPHQLENALVGARGISEHGEFPFQPVILELLQEAQRIAAGETAAVEGVLAAVREGLSGVLVLRGEAGIGKTALLEWASGQAADMQLARVAGVQAETGMGFAGLHQLLVPFMGGLDELPPPQRQALGSAFGLVAGPEP